MRADRRRASPLPLLVVLPFATGLPGCEGEEAPASSRTSPDAGEGGGAPVGCHDPSTPLPDAPTDGCSDDPTFVDPELSAEENGASSESFAFFFARRCELDGAADVRACVVTELSDQASCEVSLTCATCYADFGACVNRNCWGECLKPECTRGPSASDPSQWVIERCPNLERECNACRCGMNVAAENCFAALEACAGGELDALSDACGRGGAAGGD